MNTISFPPQKQCPCQGQRKGLGVQNLVNLVHFVLQSYRNRSRCNISISHSSTCKKKSPTILKDTGKSLATCQDYEDQRKSAAPGTLGDLELVLLLMAWTGSPSSCNRGAGKHIHRHQANGRKHRIIFYRIIETSTHKNNSALR